MGVHYEPPNDGALLQGEILADIWEHRSLEPTVELPEGHPPKVHSFHHPYMVLMDAGCDLESDHRQRGEWVVPKEIEDIERLEQHSSLIPYATLCDVFDEESIKNRMAGGGVLRRAKSNQESRYHYLPEGEGPLAEQEPISMGLFFDFKRVVSVPIASLYEGIGGGSTRRLALVPPNYLYDLTQRFFAFRSRIGQP